MRIRPPSRGSVATSGWPQLPASRRIVEGDSATSVDVPPGAAGAGGAGAGGGAATAAVAGAGSPARGVVGTAPNGRVSRKDGAASGRASENSAPPVAGEAAFPAATTSGRSSRNRPPGPAAAGSAAGTAPVTGRISWNDGSAAGAACGTAGGGWFRTRGALGSLLPGFAGLSAADFGAWRPRQRAGSRDSRF